MQIDSQERVSVREMERERERESHYNCIFYLEQITFCFSSDEQ